MTLIARANSKDSFLIQVESHDENDIVVDKTPGIYLVETKTNSKTNATYTVETYVSTLITVVEKIKSESAIYYKVEFYDNNARQARYVKAADLFSDGYKDSDDFKHMLNNGLIIAYKMKPYLVDYLKSAAITLPTKPGTEKSGWTEDWHYIGNGVNTSEIIYTGRGAPPFEVRGSREQYIAKVRSIFSENPLVFACVSYCASGFILKHLRNEINQVLAITGVSSTGKSTAGKLALSLFTHPRHFKPMDATKGGMSMVAHQAKDNFVFFDEAQENTMTPEQRVSFVFSLANASQRVRLQKEGDGFGVKDQEEQHKYAILIAGNKSFLSGVNHSAMTQGATDARFLEIILPASIPLWDSIKSSDQAESLNQFLLDNYGHLAKEYVEYIRKNRAAIVRGYEQSLGVIRGELGDSTAITMRKARILAYTLETAKILAKLLFADTPDLQGEVADNAYLALKAALFINSDTEIIDNYKEELSHIESTQSQHFELRHDNELNETVKTNEYQQIKEYYGYIWSRKTEKHIGIISTKITDACIKLGFDEKQFLAYAKENNLLQHDKNKLTKKIMVKGVRAHYYVLKIPNVFFDMNRDEFQEHYQATIGEDSPWK